MKILVTKPQYGLIKKVLPIMASFYRNNFEPLFQLIEEDYGLPEGAAKDAAGIIHNIQITTPAYRKAISVEDLSSTWNFPEATEEQPYNYTVELSDNQRTLLSKTLDIFSRIVMGQLHILFEALDVPDEFNKNQHMMQAYHDAYWDGGAGAKEARDILFPAIKNFGWHGGYGISNQNVAEDSRLAYQLSRALENKYALPVTSEPIILMR